ncbi:MAG TPA: GNAT family N-acetyltransferase [Candidatus Sulfotelmatobacter sp.]|nr:GNAT family N-acetyltransferase [Candidatus Sulfotelmatobacter sp.]
MQLEALRKEHWPRVQAIYLEGIATGQATFRTDAPEWEEWDGGHLAHSRIVALLDGEVVGWAALSPVSSRPHYRGVAEVSVYVGEGARGKGIGSALLAELVRLSEASGIWTLQSSIFPENRASVRLHERHGFRLMGRRERIAQHGGVWRDTVILERRSKTIGV